MVVGFLLVNTAETIRERISARAQAGTEDDAAACEDCLELVYHPISCTRATLY